MEVDSAAQDKKQRKIEAKYGLSAEKIAEMSVMLSRNQFKKRIHKAKAKAQLKRSGKKKGLKLTKNKF